MATIRVNGDTSGYVQLSAPANAGNTTVTLPSTSGTMQLVPGAWTDFTPTLSSSSGTFTSATVSTAKYIQIGKIVHCRITVSITTNGTAAGVVAVSLPVTAHPSGAFAGCGRENNVTGKMLQVIQGSTTFVSIINYDNTYPGGNGYGLVCSFTYEAA
jgi:hypothetical protein